eukprot:SAG31_NODE_10858_length_1089_cov_2.058586_1_plen_101_part_00
MRTASLLVIGCLSCWLPIPGDALGPEQVPCPSSTSWPWCDHTKPMATRVASLVADLKPDEKAGLFTNGVAGVGECVGHGLREVDKNRTCLSLACPLVARV